MHLKHRMLNQIRKRVRSRQQHEHEQQPETCTANLERLDAVQELYGETIYEYEGSGEMYVDKTFEGQHALYWNDYIGDESIVDRYKDQVTGWARPSELVKEPSLWGS